MKKLFALSAILAVLSFFPTSTSASSPLLNNIVSYWKLDGNSTDSVSTNNGTDTAITYSTANGIINQGAGFGGSSKITTGQPANLLPSALTINMWVKMGSLTQAYNSVIAAYHSATTANQILVKSSGKVAMYLANTGGTAISYDGTGSHTLVTGTWYMLTLTYDSTNGLIGYVNGVSDGTAAANGTLNTSYYAAEPFTIGDDPNFTGRSVTGDIDEVGVWSRALTSTEVSQLYNSGAGLQYPFGSAAPTVPPFNLIWW